MSLLKVSSIDELSGVRGVPELTQGEEVVEQKLIDNVNETGNKRLGFNKTRLSVLANTNKRNIASFVDMCMDVSEKQLKTEPVKQALTYTAGKVLRDHVTFQMAKGIRRGVITRSTLLGRDGAVDSIEQYIKCGRIVPATQTYKELKEEADEGMVIYLEPNE